MTKILKVTIEYEDETLTVEGKEAEKWHQHCQSIGTLAYIHNMNPFDTDPINWKTTKK